MCMAYNNMDGISKVLYPIISIMYITGIQKTFIKQSVEEHIWYGFAILYYDSRSLQLGCYHN